MITKLRSFDKGLCPACERSYSVVGPGVVRPHRMTRVRARYEADGSVSPDFYRTTECCDGAGEPPLRAEVAA